MKRIHTLRAPVDGMLLADIVACGGSVHALQHLITARVSNGNDSATRVDANLKNLRSVAFNPKSVAWVAR